MDVTKPFRFIWFGAMGVTKPYKFIAFRAMDVTKPYEFIWLGDIHGLKRYKFIGFRWAFISQTPGGDRALGLRVLRLHSAELGGHAFLTVSYGDRTPRVAGLSEEGTFGPGLGRILMGKAAKSILRPAFGRPEGRL